MFCGAADEKQSLLMEGEVYYIRFCHNEMRPDIIKWAKEAFKDSPELAFGIMVILILSGITSQIFIHPPISIPETIILSIIIVSIAVIACFSLHCFQNRNIVKKRDDSTEGINKVDKSFGVVVKKR